jgi:putative transcriptional regulator
MKYSKSYEPIDIVILMLYIYNIMREIYNIQRGNCLLLTTRIKEYRVKFDMNQQTLAEMVNVRRETIGHLERGNYNPSLKLAWDIAKVFHVSIEEIFNYDEEE